MFRALGLEFRALPLCLALAMTLAWASEARATPFTIYFEGVVDNISPRIAGGSLQLGAPVHGRVVIERDGPAVLAFDLTIADYTVSQVLFPGQVNSSVRVVDVSLPSNHDEVFLATAAATGATVNGQLPEIMQFALINLPEVTGLDLIHGDALPSLAELTAWGQDLRWTNVRGSLDYLIFRTFSPGDRIDWNLTRIEVVPEPEVGRSLTPALIAVAVAVGRAARRRVTRRAE
jgi:hypothetical protein